MGIRNLNTNLLLKPEEKATEQITHFGFPGSSVSKESTCSAGDPGSIPESGRSPGEGIGYTPVFLGFPGGSDSKESACSAGDLGSIPDGKIPWRRAWQPTPIFLPGECHGQRSLGGCSLWGHKELDTTE